MGQLDRETDRLQAIAHGAIGLVNTALLLAIVAVVLSSRAQAAQAIQAAFSLLAWLVGQIVTPVTAGTDYPLTSSLAPAWGGANATGSTAASLGGALSGLGGASSGLGGAGNGLGGASSTSMPGSSGNAPGSYIDVGGYKQP